MHHWFFKDFEVTRLPPSPVPEGAVPLLDAVSICLNFKAMVRTGIARAAGGGGRACTNIIVARFCCTRLPIHNVHFPDGLAQMLKSLTITRLSHVLHAVRLLVSGGHNMAVLTRGV